jgi:hypothetical protein
VGRGCGLVHFLSNGDFNFPFDWVTYWTKHFYVWLYQTGAPNPDGIIRLPGRLFNFIVFAFFGNVIVGYFYIVLCLAVAFGAFWYFSTVFLGLKSRTMKLFASLFFTLNPIFLGNLSKIGLILAVAMLPLTLAFLKRWFAAEKVNSFFLCVFCMNIALLHPYTFAVDLLVVVVYFLYKLGFGDRTKIKKRLLTTLIVAFMSVLINAYFLLPLLSLGTLDKSAIVSDVNTTNVDYARLVDIANTGDIFTGLSLSKNVLKDYDFYNSDYAGFYFAGVFLVYIIIFGVYCWINKRVNRTDTKKFLFSVSAVLLLILISAVNYLYVSDIIKWLVNMPGGWIFRSPLKWQLYIPFFMTITLAIGLKYIKKGWEKRLILAALSLGLIFANAYLCVDIYNKLLAPRHIAIFQSLNDMSIKDNNMLFVGSSDCNDLTRQKPAVMAELNQVLSSKSLQLKRADIEDMANISLGNFDYVLTCRANIEDPLVTHYHFSHINDFADGAFVLFANKSSKSYIYASPGVVKLENKNDLAGKYEFLSQRLGYSFPFIMSETSQLATSLQDPFDSLLAKDIQNGHLTSSIPSSGKDSVVGVKNDADLYYKISNNEVAFSAVGQDGFTLLPRNIQQIQFATKNGGTRVSYYDPHFDYKNLIPNPSFENGLWHDKVGNCYSYDNNPKIWNRLDNKDKTDGRQSLELGAERHVACTGPEPIHVEDGTYLLSFSYQSVGGRAAAYNLSFNDGQQTNVSERLDANPHWTSFSKIISIPKGTNSVNLKFYAFPDTGDLATGVARYDDIHLIKIPDVRNKFYIFSGAGVTDVPGVDFVNENPTKKRIVLHHAKHPFYLVMKDSYSKLWRLSMANLTKGEPPDNHIIVDFASNAWYVDPVELCRDAPDCQQNADGSYDVSLTIEFTPQKWFYVGLGISGISIVSVLGYMLYGSFRSKKRQSQESTLQRQVYNASSVRLANQAMRPKVRRSRVRIIQ